MTAAGVPATDDSGREALLALCERAFVAQDDWRNRDSSAAQRQLGECYALLRAGCEFHVHTKGDTHWVWIEFLGFDAFEYGREHKDDDRFYVPTAERLDRAGGKDWY